MEIKKLRLFYPAIFIALFLIFSTYGAGKNSSLIEPGATLKTIQSGFQGTEGPATDSEGNVYFTEVRGERINKWTWKDGTIKTYRENTGRANGMMFDAKGRLIICESANSRITCDDMKGDITVITDSCDGKKLEMPNDVWIDSKGGIYFTESSRNKNSPEGELGVDYISPDGMKVTRVTDDLFWPNGLIGTPEGQTLYVGDLNRVWSYKTNSDGTLTGKQLFCDCGKETDGMAMDEKRNVYIGTEKAVLIYSPEGEFLEEIPLPAGSSNVEFCGKDRKTLFITYREFVYTLEMAVKGAPTALDLARGEK